MKIYWRIELILQQHKRKDFRIWATDNNGQVIRNPDTGDEIIGKCATSDESGKGNGMKLAKYCRNKNMFIDNTYWFPKKGGGGLNTWTNGNEHSGIQIDYTAVSNENMDWETNAQTKGVDDPNRPLQRATIQIDIKYDIIRAKKPNNGNKHINFDIEKLRANEVQLKRNPTEN